MSSAAGIAPASCRKKHLVIPWPSAATARTGLHHEYQNRNCAYDLVICQDRKEGIRPASIRVCPYDSAILSATDPASQMRIVWHTNCRKVPYNNHAPRIGWNRRRCSEVPPDFFSSPIFPCFTTIFPLLCGHHRLTLKQDDFRGLHEEDEQRGETGKETVRQDEIS